MAAPTPALQQFMLNNLGQAVRAQLYDDRARSTLRGKYDEFCQGLLNVIQHRTGQVSAMNLQPGGRNSDPSNDAHPEYWCLQCRAYKTDITRHLVTHNKHPGDMVYCPACLEPMSRNDATTLPEHILNVHPEVIFGPGPHPLWPLLQQNRIVMMLNTTEAIHLKRLQIDPLRAMIKRDQSALLDAYHGVEHLGELDADDDVDVSQLVNFITGNAAGAVALPVGGNGLATDAAIDGMTARMARSYLQILRVARQTVEAAT